jgi:hypothetical protein
MILSMNLNEMVSVILTESGAKIYNKYYSNIRGYSEGSELKIQLWELMAVFGPDLWIGPPFRDNLVRMESKS